jgi:hypothetical protein
MAERDKCSTYPQATSSALWLPGATGTDVTKELSTWCGGDRSPRPSDRGHLEVQPGHSGPLGPIQLSLVSRVGHGGDGHTKARTQGPAVEGPRSPAVRGGFTWPLGTLGLGSRP